MALPSSLTDVYRNIKEMLQNTDTDTAKDEVLILQCRNVVAILLHTIKHFITFMKTSKHYPSYGHVTTRSMKKMGLKSSIQIQTFDCESSTFKILGSCATFRPLCARTVSAYATALYNATTKRETQH